MGGRRCAHCGHELHAGRGSAMPKLESDSHLDGASSERLGESDSVVFYSVAQPDGELAEWHDWTTHTHDSLSGQGVSGVGDTSAKGASRSSFLLGAAALLIAAIALVTALLNSTGIINPSSSAEPEASASAAQGDAAGGDGVDEPGGALPGASAAIDGNDVEVEAGPAVDIGQWFEEVVDRDGKTYSVVYPSSDGLRILDANGVASAAPQNAVGFEDARGLRLFSDGEQTWGVNPGDPFDNWIVSRNYAVVDMGIEGAVAFVNSDKAQISVGVSSFGGWGGGMVLPPGTETLSIQGLGLLVLPETGGTLMFKGGKLDPFSEDRIVAGNGKRVVAQRCDEALVCTLHLLGESQLDGSRSAGTEVVAPIGADLALSPDGKSVLVTDDGRNPRMIDIATGEVWDIDARPIDAARWASDGSFVAWLSGGDLHVAMPDERRHEMISLPTIPMTATLIVVGP